MVLGGSLRGCPLGLGSERLLCGVGDLLHPPEEPGRVLRERNGLVEGAALPIQRTARVTSTREDQGPVGRQVL